MTPRPFRIDTDLAVKGNVFIDDGAGLAHRALVILRSDTTLTYAQRGKLIVCQPLFKSMTITLPDTTQTNMDKTTYRIMAEYGFAGPVFVKPFTGQKLTLKQPPVFAQVVLTGHEWADFTCLAAAGSWIINQYAPGYAVEDETYQLRADVMLDIDATTADKRVVLPRAALYPGQQVLLYAEVGPGRTVTLHAFGVGADQDHIEGIWAGRFIDVTKLLLNEEVRAVTLFSNGKRWFILGNTATPDITFDPISTAEDITLTYADRGKVILAEPKLVDLDVNLPPLSDPFTHGIFYRVQSARNRNRAVHIRTAGSDVILAGEEELSEYKLAINQWVDLVAAVDPPEVTRGAPAWIVMDPDAASRWRVVVTDEDLIGEPGSAIFAQTDGGTFTVDLPLSTNSPGETIIVHLAGANPVNIRTATDTITGFDLLNRARVDAQSFQITEPGMSVTFMANGVNVWMIV